MRLCGDQYSSQCSSTLAFDSCSTVRLLLYTCRTISLIEEPQAYLAAFVGNMFKRGLLSSEALGSEAILYWPQFFESSFALTLQIFADYTQLYLT